MGYSQREAIEYAYLASAAYCNSDALQDWQCGVPCEETPGMEDVRRVDDDALDAHAFVGQLRGQCVLAFRGTDSPSGWAQDLQSLTLVDLPGCSFQGAACRVGSGFLQNYRAIAGGITRSLAAIGCDRSKPPAITGHSLGAAMAALAVFDMHQKGFNLTKVYTFGQPRVGDVSFARAFNAAFGSLPFFRVTKASDPFVYLPPEDPFHHVGTEVYYRGDSEQGYRICNGSGEDPTCADQNSQSNVAGLLLQCLVPSTCGHLTYLEPAKHGLMGAPACRARRLSSLFLS